MGLCVHRLLLSILSLNIIISTLLSWPFVEDNGLFCPSPPLSLCLSVLLCLCPSLSLSVFFSVCVSVSLFLRTCVFLHPSLPLSLSLSRSRCRSLFFLLVSLCFSATLTKVVRSLLNLPPNNYIILSSIFYSHSPSFFNSF